MRTTRRALFICLAALQLSGCGEQTLQYEGELGTLVPLTIGDAVPLVAVAVDEDQSRLMLLDTGSPVNLLSQHAFGARPGGWSEAVLDAFGLRLLDVPLAVTPLFGEGPCDVPVPTGIVGGEVLRFFQLGLDYRQGLALLDDGDAAPPAEDPVGPAADVALEVVGGGVVELSGAGRHEIGATRLLVAVEVEGSSRWAMIDTGATHSVVAPQLLDELGRVDRPRACCLTVDTVAGSERTELARLARLRIGPFELDDVAVVSFGQRALFDALSAEVDRRVDLLLGGNVLQLFASTFDYVGGTWRLARYEQTDHFDAEPFLLPGFVFCKARPASLGALVTDVFDDSDAAAQGVTAGRHLLEIDGQRLDGLDRGQMLELIRQHGEGGTVSLRFSGPDATLDVEVERVLGATR